MLMHIFYEKNVLSLVVGMVIIFLFPGDIFSKVIKIKETTKNSEIIIFVHGITGDNENTWKNENSQESWPEMLMGDKDFISFDVGHMDYASPYMSHSSTIAEIAKRGTEDLEDSGIYQKYNKIYFITHSMGGIVIKQFLTLLNSNRKYDNLRKTKAVIFLSTPSQGSASAWLPAILSRNPQWSDLEESDTNSFLQTLESHWRALFNTRKESQKFPLSFCAYEKKPVQFWVISKVIVDEIHAKTSCDNDPYPMDFDHIEMAKPKNKSGVQYEWVKKKILHASGRRSSYSVDWEVEPNEIKLNNLYEGKFSIRNLSAEEVAWRISNLEPNSYHLANKPLRGVLPAGKDEELTLIMSPQVLLKEIEPLINGIHTQSSSYHDLFSTKVSVDKFFVNSPKPPKKYEVIIVKPKIPPFKLNFPK